MPRSTLRRLLTAAASAVALATVAVPSPALAAGDFFFSRTSGTVVSTSWLETGWFPKGSGVPGNAHFGELFVEDRGNGRAFVFGIVHDVRCDAGVVPYNPGGGHGGEAPADGPCRVVLERFIEGGTVRFTVDRKLTRARLTGTLTVSAGHGTGPTGAPAVDITWTGVGPTYSGRETGTFEDETGTYSYRYAFTGRDADVAAGSRIGPMVFDDERNEWSEAQLGRFRNAERQRS